MAGIGSEAMSAGRGSTRVYEEEEEAMSAVYGRHWQLELSADVSII
jgi:hypothetical protein